VPKINKIILAQIMGPPKHLSTRRNTNPIKKAVPRDMNNTFCVASKSEANSVTPDEYFPMYG